MRIALPFVSALLCAFVGCVVGCGVGGSIRAADFDQSCGADDDCVVVTEGEKCVVERCSCGNAAINRDALDEFESAYEWLPCIPDATECSVCLCGVAPDPVCEEGSCVLPIPQ